MASEYKNRGHSIYDVQYYVCWCTKYRYAILRGEIAECCRDLLRQIAMAREITIVRGTVVQTKKSVLLAT
jgi:putative transposase